MMLLERQIGDEMNGQVEMRLFTLFLLFIRFLPLLSMAEMRAMLPGAHDPEAAQ